MSIRQLRMGCKPSVGNEADQVTPPKLNTATPANRAGLARCRARPSGFGPLDHKLAEVRAPAAFAINAAGIAVEDHDLRPLAEVFVLVKIV